MTSAAPEPEELVYAAAIVILSNELYPRKLEVVREYIQNASDAIDSFTQIADVLGDRSSPQIKISIQGRSLLIWDNGIGMDKAEISKLKRIAYSEKREGEEAGYKGIGRLAGIAVANKLLISSTCYGDPKLHKFEFRARDFQEDISAKKREGLQEPASFVINHHTTISEFDVDPREHYTMVELREIDEAHPELLDPDRLNEFIGEIAPVGFAPDFKYGDRISDSLAKHVPDYSPKAVWLTTSAGDRIQIYKPYANSMMLSDPEFIDITDSNDGRALAYCWCATRGKEMLGRIRAAGNKFVVPGTSPEERKRFAGLAYKLFGFSIGDRNLPLRTLWKKDYTRPLWFTGEIHIVDKAIKPTTDRSDFIDNDPRRRLYSVGEKRIARHLNNLAQTISNNRQAHDLALKWKRRFEELGEQLDEGGIERAEVKSRKDELNEALESQLKRDCKDKEILSFVRQVAQEGRTLQKRLGEAKIGKDSNSEISDLAHELRLTSAARKVYMIIMETLEHYFRDDKDVYYELSAKIKQALKKKY
jgi:molecular chaperone HtpG